MLRVVAIESLSLIRIAVYLQDVCRPFAMINSWNRNHRDLQLDSESKTVRETKILPQTRRSVSTGSGNVLIHNSLTI